MANLNPLIRFRKHIVEEKQKLLSQLYREAEKLELQKKVIEDQLEKEKNLANEVPDAGVFYGRYAEGARLKIKKLQESMKKMETRIMTAQEDMRTAFADFKKIQITQRNREEREEEDRRKKDAAELDEIAIDTFRRREE